LVESILIYSQRTESCVCLPSVGFLEERPPNQCHHRQPSHNFCALYAVFRANCRQRFFGGLRLLSFCREPNHHSSDARFEVGGLGNQSEEILGAQGGPVEKHCQMRSHAEDDEIFGIDAFLFQRLQQRHHPLLTLCDF
ncbi:unnamed protein product, partial [Ectocarpus sp. 12 AP-2014]